MNQNYFIGKTWSEARDWVLRRRPPVLWKRYPRGRIFPLDLQRFSGAHPVRMIFDVGANDGRTAVELSAWFPGATIHSFEPVRSTFSQLKNRIAGRQNCFCHHLACGAEPGTARIRLREDSERSTLLAGPATSLDVGEEMVTVTTLDRFCSDVGVTEIDLLKTDTEGFDLHVIHGAARLIADRRVRFIYSEVGLNGQSGQTPFHSMWEHLTGNGFSFSGWYEPFRSGKQREVMWFCNALFTRRN